MAHLFSSNEKALRREKVKKKSIEVSNTFMNLITTSSTSGIVVESPNSDAVVLIENSSGCQNDLLKIRFIHTTSNSEEASLTPINTP